MIIRDGDWTLFSADIALGRTVWSRLEPDGSTTYRVEQQVDNTQAINKEQRSIAKRDWGGDYHHVASIPVELFHHELATAAREGDDRFINRWLNDSDNAAWRTKSGRL